MGFNDKLCKKTVLATRLAHRAAGAAVARMAANTVAPHAHNAAQPAAGTNAAARYGKHGTKRPDLSLFQKSIQKNWIDFQKNWIDF